MYSGARRGFTIVELAIVVVIIGLLAALAIPLFSLILKKSRLNTLSNDLRIHSEAIQNYTMEAGSFPPSHGTAGAYIPGLEGILSVRWLDRSPVGGRYTWVYTTNPDESRRSAYIQISESIDAPFSISLTDVKGLDEDIDDGRLSSGYLQVAGGNRIRYFIRMPAN